MPTHKQCHNSKEESWMTAEWGVAFPHYPKDVSNSKDDRHSLADAYNRFMEFNKMVKNLAASTHRFYRQQVLPFVNHCEDNGVQNLTNVTGVMVEEYIDHRRNNDLSDASIQSAFRALRAFFNFCVKQELIDKSPMAKMSMPKAERRQKPFFSEAEIKTLYELVRTDGTRSSRLF